MRITRDTLLKLARDTVQARVQRNRRLVCIYLTGSLLDDEPLLGGATDIDLIFVHDGDPLIDREVTRLSDDVHLDIAHFGQNVFHQPRHLRGHPWIGPFLCQSPIVLHDSHHWFEFTQASVCAQFNRPESVLIRAAKLSSEARQLWMDLHLGNVTGETARVRAYLDALERAANAVASYSGPPLTERRMLLGLPARAEAVERPGLSAGLVDLLDGGDRVEDGAWQTWQPHWHAALDAAAELPDAPPRLQPCRKTYYTRAAAALWDPEPAAALWIALRTWTLALDTLGPDAPGLPAWRDAFASMGLLGESFDNRLALLDVYLDNIEELRDSWAQEYGIEANI